MDNASAGSAQSQRNVCIGNNTMRGQITDGTTANVVIGFEAGTVLDPFFGAGTVAIVAEELSLNWIGIELKKEYADIATERLKPYINQERL